MRKSQTNFQFTQRRSKGRCITCGSENCESYYKLHASYGEIPGTELRRNFRVKRRRRQSIRVRLHDTPSCASSGLGNSGLSRIVSRLHAGLNFQTSLADLSKRKPGQKCRYFVVLKKKKKNDWNAWEKPEGKRDSRRGQSTKNSGEKPGGSPPATYARTTGLVRQRCGERWDLVRFCWAPIGGGVYQPIMSFRSEVKRVETKGLVKMSAQFTLVSTFSTLNVP